MLKRSTTERATPEEIAAKRSAELARAAGDPIKPKLKKAPKPAPASRRQPLRRLWRNSPQTRPQSPRINPRQSFGSRPTESQAEADG